MKVLVLFCISISLALSTVAQTADDCNGWIHMPDEESHVSIEAENDHKSLIEEISNNRNIPSSLNRESIAIISHGINHTAAIDKEDVLWIWTSNKYLRVNIADYKGVLGSEKNTLPNMLVEYLEAPGSYSGENSRGLIKSTSSTSEANVTHFILMAIFFSLMMAIGTGITLYYRLQNGR